MKKIIVRTSFFAVSASCWFIFLVGFGKQLHSIKEKRKTLSKAELKHVDSLSKVLTGPLWLFLVSSSLLYITDALHIIVSSRNTNTKHLLQILVTFFNFFFSTSGTLSASVGMIYQIKDIKPFVVQALPDALAMKLILIGSLLSLVVYWIGLGVFPLFNIRRQRYRGYTELQESIQAPIAS